MESDENDDVLMILPADVQDKPNKPIDNKKITGLQLVQETLKSFIARLKPGTVKESAKLNSLGNKTHSVESFDEFEESSERTSLNLHESGNGEIKIEVKSDCNVLRNKQIRDVDKIEERVLQTRFLENIPSSIFTKLGSLTSADCSSNVNKSSDVSDMALFTEGNMSKSLFNNPTTESLLRTGRGFENHLHLNILKDHTEVDPKKQIAGNNKVDIEVCTCKKVIKYENQSKVNTNFVKVREFTKSYSLEALNRKRLNVWSNTEEKSFNINYNDSGTENCIHTVESDGCSSKWSDLAAYTELDRSCSVVSSHSGGNLEVAGNDISTEQPNDYESSHHEVRPSLGDVTWSGAEMVSNFISKVFLPLRVFAQCFQGEKDDIATTSNFEGTSDELHEYFQRRRGRPFLQDKEKPYRSFFRTRRRPKNTLERYAAYRFDFLDDSTNTLSSSETSSINEMNYSDPLEYSENEDDLVRPNAELNLTSKNNKVEMKKYTDSFFCPSDEDDSAWYQFWKHPSFVKFFGFPIVIFIGMQLGYPGLFVFLINMMLGPDFNMVLHLVSGFVFAYVMMKYYLHRHKIQEDINI